MGTMTGCDEVLGIKNPRLTVDNILASDRIHVVNQQLYLDLAPGDTKIATMIAHDHDVTDLMPEGGSVEPLVQPPSKPEGLISDLTPHGQVFKAFYEGR